MTANSIKGDDVDVDLGTLFSSLLRNWLAIVGVALVAMAAAFLVATMVTPQYRAETRILIETGETVFTRPTQAGEGDRPAIDDGTVASQVEIITSTDLLGRVASELGLAKLKEFDPRASMSPLSRLFVLFGLKNDPGELALEDRVLSAMREKLTVYRVEGSRVIVVQFASRDPKLAAAVPNAIADAYIALQQSAKEQSTSNATAWLEPEIADLRERVRAAETRVAEFRAQSDVMVGQNNAALATQQLSEMSSELSRVRAARATAEANAQSVRDYLARGGTPEAMPEVLASPLIQRLRERQVQLNGDIAEQSTTLLDNHPRLKALRSQLGELNTQLDAEVRNVLRGLETEAASAKLREAKLVANLNQLKAESARVGDKEVELRALEREAASQRDLLESYLLRYREAASRSDRSNLPVDARVFSRANVPSEPFFPKVVPIVAAAFVGAILLMAIVTLLRELFSGRAMRPAPGREMEPATEIAMPERPVEADLAAPPAVRVLPEAESVPVAAAAMPAAPQVVEPAPPAQPIAPPIPDDRLTVDAAADRLIAGGVSRAVFVSPEGDEGAATSVMVAREIADSGLRALLLDLTTSAAASTPMLDRMDLPGITDLLAAEAQYSEVIHLDRYSECHVIPAGTADPQRAMRAADRLPIIMDSLTTAYDVVVVECGPANADSIRRLVGEGTQVFVSALEPADALTTAVADNLRAGGHGDLELVKPEMEGVPRPPQPRRSAA